MLFDAVAGGTFIIANTPLFDTLDVLSIITIVSLIEMPAKLFDGL